jgi:hypothetical protein
MRSKSDFIQNKTEECIFERQIWDIISKVVMTGGVLSSGNIIPNTVSVRSDPINQAEGNFIAVSRYHSINNYKSESLTVRSPLPKRPRYYRTGDQTELRFDAFCICCSKQVATCTEC